MGFSAFELPKSDTEKLTVSVAKTKNADLIATEAEKEFKHKLSEVCKFATEARDPNFKIFYPNNLRGSSKFWASIVSIVNLQTSVFEEIEPESESD